MAAGPQNRAIPNREPAPRVGRGRFPLWFVGERKDARSLRSTRCFLRVWEDSFSGAAYGLSTPKRAGKQLLRPIVFECSAGVVASRRMGLCPDFPELDEGKLSLRGLRPDFSELARKNCPRQGYRALDCGTRFAFWFTAWCITPANCI
ncbi:hypothetical protein SAMN02910317_02124 [Ruminococcaceae bacterium FB2012]|nr:hypothetical protein SAMN02910317_02124 [Ruminococcaceae bacterium FB2012]